MMTCPICQDVTLWINKTDRDVHGEARTRVCTRCGREMLLSRANWATIRAQPSDTIRPVDFLPLNFSDQGTVAYHLTQLGCGYQDCVACRGVTRHSVLVLRNAFHGSSFLQCARCSHRTGLVSAEWAELERSR